MKMKPSELLKKKGWCQYIGAKDKNGDPADYDSKEAVAFCLTIAIMKCYKQGSSQMFNKFRNVNNIGTMSLVIWNDKKGRTKEQVIKALEKAGL